MRDLSSYKIKTRLIAISRAYDGADERTPTRAALVLVEGNRR